MPVTTAVTDAGDAFWSSLSGAMALFFAAIPKILAFALILVVGWFLASLVAKLVARVLRAIRFNEVSQRAGITDFINRMGLETDGAGFFASVAKWFIRLVVAVVAFDALGLPAVSEVVHRALVWLPQLAVALVVLVLGGLGARAASGVVRAASQKAGFTNPELLARVASIAIWAFAIIIAVNQVGVADELVNTLFMATVGAVALAAGLAFGLGGRETAAQILGRAYASGREAATRVQRVSAEAANEARTYTGPERRGQPRPAAGDD